MSGYSNIDQLSEHIRDTALTAIAKYKQHSSIIQSNKNANLSKSK